MLNLAACDGFWAAELESPFATLQGLLAHREDARSARLCVAGVVELVLGRVQQDFEPIHNARAVAFRWLPPGELRLPSLHQRHQLLLLDAQESCRIGHCREDLTGEEHQSVVPATVQPPSWAGSVGKSWTEKGGARIRGARKLRCADRCAASLSP